jgi:ribosomal protein S18 acetylase RimI-like enzyme
MDSFFVSGEVAEHLYPIEIVETKEVTPELVKTLVDIDMQTFSECTLTNHSAVVFLQHGRVFLLKAAGVVIGTGVCMRCWKHPQDVSIVAMGVKPGWRGRRLGLRFLEEISQRLARERVAGVRLMVSESNRRAVKLYRETGFVDIGRAGTGWESDSVLVLRRALQGNVTQLPRSSSQ